MKRRGGDGGMAAMERLLRSGTSAGVSDGQLLERFASRHDEAAEAAFAAIVERHGPMVLGVCRRILADSHDAQDAFQATFLVLVGRAEALGRLDSLGPWLFGVARRVSARSRSAAARRRVVERRASARGEPVEEAAEDRGEVWDEVGRLPGRLRDAVLMCYLEGLSHEQAAARLGWPVGTVRSRLARARDRLRRALARKGFEPPRGGAGLLGLLPPLARPSASLSTATVEAAMRFAARDAFEAGLVSASVVSLTEGALKAMMITKIQGAVVALAATTLFTVGAFAYQEVGTSPKAAEAVPPSGAEAAPPNPVARTSGGERGAGDTPSKLDSTGINHYLEMINHYAEAAARAHASNDLDAAIIHTQRIERLALQWRELLSHMKSDDGPAASAAPPVVLDGSGAPPPNATAPVPAPSQAGPTVVAPTTGAPSPGYGGMGQDPAGELRIRRLELKLDQILQALGQRPSTVDPNVSTPPAGPGALPAPVAH